MGQDYSPALSREFQVEWLNHAIVLGETETALRLRVKCLVTWA